MSLIFDHTKKSLSEAMGMSEEDVLNLSKTLTEITKKYITNPEFGLKSKIAEEIALNLSYNELVFLAVHKVKDTAEEITQNYSHSLSTLKELLDKLTELKGNFDKNPEDED